MDRLIGCVAWLAAIPVALAVGCGDYQPAAVPPPSAEVASPTPQDQPAAAPAPVPAPSPAEPAPPASTAAEPAVPQGPQVRSVEEVEGARVKAEVGAGKKGDYGPGFVTTPVSVFWRTQEMVAYRTQVPHALNLYQAEHGHFPKTKDEFVREILEKNGIKLPELPEGHEYVYDPQKGELQVARSK